MFGAHRSWKCAIVTGRSRSHEVKKSTQATELAEVTQDLVKTTTQGIADLDFKATVLRLFEEPVEDG